MESSEDEDDIKLAQASARLLADLEIASPKILWKPNRTNSGTRRVHSQVSKQDLEYIVRLVWSSNHTPCNQDLPVVLDRALSGRAATA